MPPEADRILLEDALKHLRSMEERSVSATLESLAGALQLPTERAAQLFEELTAAGWGEHRQGVLELTPAGRERALQLVRAHRLYETYLARHTGVPETAWHREAHAAEHRMTDEEVNALAHNLGYPRFDPHGDPIPKRDGEVSLPASVHLLDQPVGWEGELNHIEDEPEATYRRLVAVGFAAGMRVKVLARSPAGLRLNLEGRVVTVSAQDAANLECAPQASRPALEGERPVRRLSDIGAGERVEVEGLASVCRGAERRRLLDLGLVPGSIVELDFASPFGSPRAYFVRGTLIGLRREQADAIIVRPVAREVVS